MTDLASSVRVRRRFQRAVRVDQDIRAAALEGFVCPNSSVDAVTSMIRQVKDTAQAAFTWTGPYGCGKSSLAVAFAALLGEPQLRYEARRALGSAVATTIENELDPASLGWVVVPVVGSRTDPADAISEKLGLKRDATDQMATKSGHDVVARLVELSADPAKAGVILIIDEMGKFLEEAAFGSGDVYFFQLLAEAASRTGGRLIVVGILHQAFDDYANRLGREVRDEWLKIQGRYSDVPINVAGEEQIEILARAIEVDDPPSGISVDAKGIADAIHLQRPTSGSDLALRLHECWPLHPTVAVLLGPLSRRRFGQNQRSIFGFLNSAEPFGFQDYLRSEAKQVPAPYRITQLWDYLRSNLEPSILASPDGHRWSLAVDAVDRAEAKGGDATHVALVKAVALIDLFKERSGLLPSWAVLEHTLSHIDSGTLQKCLEDLKEWSVVIFRRHLNAFAIYAGSDFDIDAAVAEVRSRLPVIDLARLRSLALLQPVLAKRHYHETGALRWFDVDICAISDGPNRARGFRPKNNATGLFLLLIGSEAETNTAAKRLWKETASAATEWPVAVGWTRDSFMIRELAAELICVETVRTDRSELQGDEVARREVSARIARLSAEVEDRINSAFNRAEWTWSGAVLLANEPPHVSLNSMASEIADHRYRNAPRVKNELLNRIKPSSNAIAAQKELLKAMVERWHLPRLGFEGFPAAAGLYASILVATSLHRARPNDISHFHFADPPADDEARLLPLWLAAEALFVEAASSGADLSSLYDLWRLPPFGLRDGLMPVLAIAFLMSRSGRLSVYLDGAFQPTVSALLIDRMTQDPRSVRLRWTEIGAFHAQVLEAVTDLVGELSSVRKSTTHPEPIEVARALVGLVLDLPNWVQRTATLSPVASKVRNLIKLASDPNKFLFDDLPAIYGEGRSLDAGDAHNVINELRSGLTELTGAYSSMLAELEAVMMGELRVAEVDAQERRNLLFNRAQAVKGLTGNYRLDAFATRLSTFTGQLSEIEGIASLAANKPPKDWIDRDIDHARIEIAALAQEFVKAEAFAHVKGRENGRTSMAIFIGDPKRPSPIRPNFDVTPEEGSKVARIVHEFEAILLEAGVSRDIALAALAELVSKLASESEDEQVKTPRLQRK
ncbi:hypothetical protein [Rhizobium leguminosarum]|uniref:hypothetical protein n=1 Tax=Rhizobium leguminosarum TaxID=384 RepID=UPI0003602A13|nr:hypothetical protein [Rhizobium leguminosarum]